MRGKLFVVVVLRGEALAQTLAMETEHGGVAGDLDIGHVEAAPPPREPRVAELVVLDTEGLVAQGGVGVLLPQGPALVQVLVRVDDHRHSPASSCPVWPMAVRGVRGGAAGSLHRRAAAQRTGVKAPTLVHADVMSRTPAVHDPSVS